MRNNRGPTLPTLSAGSTDCDYYIKSGPGEFKQWATVVQKKEHKGKKKDCKCVCEEEGCDLIPLWIITRGRKSVSPIFMILKIKVCQSNVSWATTKAESTWLGALYALKDDPTLFICRCGQYDGARARTDSELEGYSLFLLQCTKLKDH